MKKFYLTIFTFLVVLSTAQAEKQSIAVEISKNEKKDTLVTIHSDVDSEKKTKISIQEASLILKGSKGWGSTVGVAIKVDGVDLSEDLPLLTQIAADFHLDLDGLHSGAGNYHKLTEDKGHHR